MDTNGTDQYHNEYNAGLRPYNQILQDDSVCLLIYSSTNIIKIIIPCPSVSNLVSMEFFIVYVILLLVSFGNFCFFGLFTVCFLLQLQNLLRAGNPSTLAEDLFDIFRVDYFPFQQYLSQHIVA